MALLSRTLVFAAIAILYLAVGWLNLEQAGRLGLLGLADMLAVSALTTRKGTETRLGKACVLAVVFVFLMFMSFHGFLREYFGVAADEDSVMAAIFGSDRTEAGEFLEQHLRALLKHVSIVLVLTFLFAVVLRQWPRAGAPEPSLRRKWITVGSCLLLFVGAHINPSMRNMDPALYFPSRHAHWKQEVIMVRQLQSQMQTAVADPRLRNLHCEDDSPRTVVFMLSESITRRNFPYAGYPRNTSPELEALGDEITWFSDVVSCDGSTVPALSKILTPATIGEPDSWLQKPALFLMAKKAGYKTFWLSNHTTDTKGLVSIFAKQADHVVFANRGSSRGEGSLDEVLLPLVEEALKDPSPRKFIVVHLLGGHPAYYYRYPKSFARFNNADDAVARELKAAGRAFWAVAMRNYYDNAVLYSDFILRRSIDLCRNSGQRVAWLFVPDHGQDAAHNNNFAGHNGNAITQYEIPMMFWRSPSFPAPPTDRASLAARPYQTDVLDHTLLGLMGITGDYYDRRHDILSPDFQPSPRSIRGEPWPGTNTPP